MGPLDDELEEEGRFVKLFRPACFIKCAMPVLAGLAVFSWESKSGKHAVSWKTKLTDAE